jgi:hypothetical protein
VIATHAKVVEAASALRRHNHRRGWGEVVAGEEKELEKRRSWRREGAGEEKELEEQ